MFPCTSPHSWCTAALAVEVSDQRLLNLRLCTMRPPRGTATNSAPENSSNTAGLCESMRGRSKVQTWLIGNPQHDNSGWRIRTPTSWLPSVVVTFRTDDGAWLPSGRHVIAKIPGSACGSPPLQLRHTAAGRKRARLQGIYNIICRLCSVQRPPQQHLSRQAAA